MAIKEARKLLGDEALNRNDEEVLQLIKDLDVIAQYTIKLVQEFEVKEEKTD